MTDTPVVVTAAYLDAKAAKDPAGPTLVVIPRAQWAGVLNALPVTFPTPGWPASGGGGDAGGYPAPKHHRRK